MPRAANDGPPVDAVRAPPQHSPGAAPAGAAGGLRALSAGRWASGDPVRVRPEPPGRGRSMSAPVEAAPPPVTGDDAGPGRQYEIIDGALCQMRVDRDGTRSAHPLCNFTAQIVEEITLD